MSDLPIGWILSEIGEIAEYIQRGKSPKYTDKSDLPVINQKCIRWDGVDPTYLKFIHPEQWDSWTPERFLRSGDLLWNSTGTGTIGRAALFTELEGYGRAVVDSHVTIVRCNTACNPYYLHYFIKSPFIQKRIEEMHTGSTNQVELSRSEVLRTSIPLPPLGEQGRIVEKLDELLGRSRRAREELQHIPKLIQRYKQAVLAAAFRGDLTADWRETQGDIVSESVKDLLSRIQQKQGIIIADIELPRDQFDVTIPDSWLWTKVENIGQVFLGRQRSPKHHHGSNMHPYVRAANITWNGWDTSDIKEMNFDDRDFEKYRLQLGDVLVNEGSGSADEVGKPAIWNGEINDCCFQNTLICVRPFESMSKYLYFLFLYAARSKIFVEDTRGVNIFHIGKEKLAKFKFPLPPLEEQEEIVRRIEERFKAIEAIEQNYQKAIQLLDRLDQATLAKAFRGQLVPQDPNDEPASVLLERIRAQRASQPPARKRKPKATK